MADCKAMERMCIERAEADPAHSGKWLGQADRWRDLAKHETAWRLQKRASPQQQAHTKPMATQPRTSDGDTRRKQQMG